MMYASSIVLSSSCQRLSSALPSGRSLSKFVALTLTLVLAGSGWGWGCTTPRYVGSWDREGSFVHRAYGLVLDYAVTDWRAIDPADPTSPPDRTPVYVQSPLDLDADGQLEDDEVSPRYEPLFALQSTSVLEAWASLRVVIVPDSGESRSTETFLRSRFHQTSGKPEATSNARTPVLTQEGLLTPDGPQAIISVAEQPEFRAEEGVVRRQLVFVRTTAPELSKRLRGRHERLVEGLSLADEAAPLRPGESYLSSESGPKSEGPSDEASTASHR